MTCAQLPKLPTLPKSAGEPAEHDTDFVDSWQRWAISAFLAIDSDYSPKDIARPRWGLQLLQDLRRLRALHMRQRCFRAAADGDQLGHDRDRDLFRRDS